MSLIGKEPRLIMDFELDKGLEDINVNTAKDVGNDTI